MTRKRLFIVLLTFIFLFNAGVANGSAATALPPKNGIILNIPTFSLTLYKNGGVVKTYPVAVGKPSTQTPIGNYKIIYKTKYPSWKPLDGGSLVPPGPKNPLGPRWINFSPGYGIHGTNNQASIAWKLASHGCVRMYNKDVIELYEKVYSGMPVQITYETMIASREKLTGMPIITVYPDPYGKGVNTVANVKLKLQELGFGKFPADSLIASLLKSNRSKPVSLTGIPDVQVNGQPINAQAFYSQGQIYLPLDAISDALGGKANYVSATGSAVVNTVPVAMTTFQGKRYVPAAKVKEIFAGEVKWDAAHGCLNVMALTAENQTTEQMPAEAPGAEPVTSPIPQPYITVGGERIDAVIIQKDRRLYLPLCNLANVLGISVQWDVGHQKIFLNEIPVDGFSQGAEFYTTIEEFSTATGVQYIWHADTEELSIIKN